MGRFGTTTGAPNNNSFVFGKIGKLAIRTDLDKASIFAPGGIGSVFIGGSIIGGAGDRTGLIYCNAGNIGSVKIGGDLRGGGGEDSGKIATAMALGPVAIGGSVFGGAGSQDTAAGFQGQIHSNLDLGPVKIGGSLIGGTNFDVGSIISNGDMDPSRSRATSKAARVIAPAASMAIPTSPPSASAVHSSAAPSPKPVKSSPTSSS